ITCIVGKNESGKTAFLHALYRCNPVHANAKFSVLQQYPAWLEKLHRKEGKDLERSKPIRAVFELEATDLSLLETRFGEGGITSKYVTVEREYSGKRWFEYASDERNAVKHLLRDTKVPTDFQDPASKCVTLEDLAKLEEALKAEGGEQS